MKEVLIPREQFGISLDFMGVHNNFKSRCCGADYAALKIDGISSSSCIHCGWKCNLTNKKFRAIWKHNKNFRKKDETAYKGFINKYGSFVEHQPSLKKTT